MRIRCICLIEREVPGKVFGISRSVSDMYRRRCTNKAKRCSPDDKVKNKRSFKCSMPKTFIHSKATVSCSALHLRNKPIESKTDNPQSYANTLYLFDRKRGSGESIWDIKKRIGYVHPLQGYRFLLRITLTKQADRIEKAGTDNIQGRDILFII